MRVFQALGLLGLLAEAAVSALAIPSPAHYEQYRDIVRNGRFLKANRTLHQMHSEAKAFVQAFVEEHNLTGFAVGVISSSPMQVVPLPNRPMLLSLMSIPSSKLDLSQRLSSHLALVCSLTMAAYNGPIL